MPTHELAGGLSYADSIDVTFYMRQDLDEKRRFDAVKGIHIQS